MNNRHRLTICAAAAVSVALSAVSFAQSDYRYAWIDLPGLNDEVAFHGASGINDSGVVVGFSAFGAGPSEYAAVCWDREGCVSILESLGGEPWVAARVDSAGVTKCGTSIYKGGNIFDPRGVVWIDQSITDIGSLGGLITDATSVRGMNNSAQVVGVSENSVGDGEAFLWEDGAMTALPNLGVNRSYAYDINDRGDVVGWVRDEGLAKAVVWWEGTRLTVLPDIGGTSNQPPSAYAINDKGVIVGSAPLPRSRYHAVAWVDEQIFDIHTDQSLYSIAQDINNIGQIIGIVGPPTQTRGFIRNPNSQMERLDDLVPPRIWQGRYVANPRSINDAGQIAVHSYKPGSILELWAVILTPVNPTMYLSEPAPGSAGESNTLTITNVTPGERVFFYYSRNGGGARIPDCDLQQNALQLHEPKLIGSAITNQNGIATITKTVPTAARNQWILMQAVVPGECAISQLVVHRFE